MEKIIEDLSLDLMGIRVLTEAASGPFVVTPLIAARAGAERVVAVARDSCYGRAQEVKEYVETWARWLGVDDQVTVSSAAARTHAGAADLVTNLAFVRPIDDDFVSRLPNDAVIALMWEPWEHRPEDLDLEACRRRGIPVLGTNEFNSLVKYSYLCLLCC